MPPDLPSIAMKHGAMSSYCEQYGISRAELARSMGVDPATAYRVVSNQVEPSPRFIASLIKVTGLPFEDLFDITDTQKASA